MFKFRKNKFDKKSQKGFTLIEMMVAVSIFVIVAFIVVSTLLALSYSYKKAQRMRLLMDNLGFSVQVMSLNIREGIGYEIPSGCLTFSDCFKFKPIDSWLSGVGGEVCYSYYSDGVRGGIKKCENSCPCVDGDLDLVSQDINITKLKFEITEGIQKNLVKIMIAGESGKNKELTDFFIQNTVSQRNVD